MPSSSYYSSVSSSSSADPYSGNSVNTIRLGGRRCEGLMLTRALLFYSFCFCLAVRGSGGLIFEQAYIDSAGSGGDAEKRAASNFDRDFMNFGKRVAGGKPSSYLQSSADNGAAFQRDFMSFGKRVPVDDFRRDFMSFGKRSSPSALAPNAEASGAAIIGVSHGLHQATPEDFLLDRHFMSFGKKRSLKAPTAQQQFQRDFMSFGKKRSSGGSGGAFDRDFMSFGKRR